MTGDGDIALPSPIAEKDTVTDGTVIWTIHKIGGGDGVPLGAILPLAHNSAVPAGYLLCDGAAVSRTMYPDLFSVIGTTYGAGDGSTTFNVPDYNTAKRFVQGDTVAGTVKSAGLPNITGSFQGRVNEGNWLNMNNFSGWLTDSHELASMPPVPPQYMATAPPSNHQPSPHAISSNTNKEE